LPFLKRAPDCLGFRFAGQSRHFGSEAFNLGVLEI
jgi:hypothetical protein